MSDSEGSQARSRRSSYSDDSFHSDDASIRGRRNSNAKPAKAARASKLPPSQAGSSRNLSRNSGYGGNSHQGANNTGTGNTAARRMLSAGRVKINELRNKIAELQVQLANVQTENKQLVRQQKQRERLLTQYEHEESEMPSLIQRMNEESNAVREQLRRAREKYNAKSKKLQEVSEELDRTQRLLKKMKTLVDDRKLAERDELSQKLTRAKEELVEKDRMIGELRHHVDNLTKNHKHELGIERARYRETLRQIEELQATDTKLQLQLKEKEKELEVRNIYALRQQRPPHRLDSSISSTATPVPHSDNQRTLNKTKLQKIRANDSMATDSENSTLDRNDERPPRQPVESRRHSDCAHRNLSAEMSRQLEQEQQMLARLQEDEEKKRQQAERERLEQERMQLQRERERVRQEQERAERERKEEQERRAREQEADRLKNSAEEQERLRQKELLLAKMKAIDEGRISTDNGISGSYQNGITLRSKRPPANEVQEIEGAVFGEYRPSFLAGPSVSAKPQKKGLEKRRELPKDEVLLFDQSEKDEKSSSPDLSFLGGGNGGGKGDAGSGDQLLPRRTRQNVNSVFVTSNKSDSDNEVEEFIL